jgi:hypothetical protein
VCAIKGSKCSKKQAIKIKAAQTGQQWGYNHHALATAAAEVSCKKGLHEGGRVCCAMENKALHHRPNLVANPGSSWAALSVTSAAY